MSTRTDHTFRLTRWSWVNFLAGIVVGVWIWRPFWAFVGDLSKTVSGMIDK